MNPEFIDWLADMKPSQWCMYGNAYGEEAYMINHEDKTYSKQTFQDFLMDCFNREHGEKIQGEDNGN